MLWGDCEADSDGDMLDKMYVKEMVAPTTEITCDPAIIYI